MGNSTGSISERILRLTGARRRVIRVLANPENVDVGPEEICRLAHVARATYWKMRRDPRFLDLLQDMRDALYPGQEAELAHRLIADALVPLQESKNPMELIRTREQAFAFLGVNLEPPGIRRSPARSNVRAPLGPRSRSEFG